MLKRKKQETLTFKKEFVEYALEENAFMAENQLKSKIARKGYIYKNFTVQKVVLLRCLAAKANWPKELREKRQEEVNKMPEPSIYYLKK